jgi:hypothetical protein
MTRSHQKFDLVPKLSLRVQLEGLRINKKYRVLTSTSQQRELYLNAFHPFCCVSDGLQYRIGNALRVTTNSRILYTILVG